MGSTSRRWDRDRIRRGGHAPGALLTLLRERIAVVWAIAATSVVFAVLHVPIILGRGPSTSEAFLVLLGHIVFGAALGYLVVRTGGLWMAIGWHAGTNGVHVTYSALSGNTTPDLSVLGELLDT